MKTQTELFLEMPITTDEKLKEAEEEYMDTVMFTTASSLNYAHSKNCTYELNIVGRRC